MDALAIPSLLKIIDTARVDPEIMARCKEALRLRYRGKTELALELGRTVVYLAVRTRGVDKRDFAAETRRRTSTGIALLYLAYIRHLSNSPRAQLTGQMAVTWLSQDDHHHGLAELVLGRMLLEQGQVDAAVEHYRAALAILFKLIELRYHKHRSLKEKEYVQLYEITQQAIRDIWLPDRRSAISAELLAEETPEPNWLDQVQIPAGLVWPSNDLVGLQLMPVQSGERYQAILSPNFRPVPGMLDYIEIEQVSLNNQSYQIDVAQQIGGKFRMYTSQPYYAFQFAAAHKPPQPGEPCYVLVRQFDRPQRSEYPIVILIPEDKQAWLVSSQPAGAAETIIGEREWIFYEGGPKIAESKVQVVGVVVAILTPLPVLAASNSS
jgi:tetratricopeptide (TPR) repeat protein